MSDNQSEAGREPVEDQSWSDSLAAWALIFCAGMLIVNLFKSFRDVRAIRSDVADIERQVREVRESVADLSRKLDHAASAKPGKASDVSK
jgi:biopolymer transport protein ExbB/TolQ